MSENDLNALSDAQRELETTLAALRPAAPAINRDALMFAAGRASAVPRRSVHVWQAATAVLAAGLCVSLLLRPTPVERIVVVAPPQETAQPLAHTPPTVTPPHDPVTPAAARLEPLPPDAYLPLRNAVLSRGIDALPPVNAPVDPHLLTPLRIHSGRLTGEQS